jgi:hypothetical protein
MPDSSAVSSHSRLASFLGSDKQRLSEVRIIAGEARCVRTLRTCRASSPPGSRGPGLEDVPSNWSPCEWSLSMLAAAFRLVYSGVLMVAIGQVLGVIRLLTDDSNLGILGADQLNAQAMVEITASNDIWYVGQFLFGLHLLLIGYLAYRSSYVPKVLGVLLAISGLGYATDSLGAVLSQGAWTDISAFTFIGEFLLALWLVIRARRIAASASALEAEPVAHRTMDEVNA